MKLGKKLVQALWSSFQFCTAVNSLTVKELTKQPCLAATHMLRNLFHKQTECCIIYDGTGKYFAVIPSKEQLFPSIKLTNTVGKKKTNNLDCLWHSITRFL